MRFVVTVAKSTAAGANGGPTCASIARIGTKVHHRRNCVPTPAKSEAIRASFVEIAESFAVTFATGAEMSVTIDTIGATRGKTE
jgi:hypothetical protein